MDDSVTLMSRYIVNIIGVDGETNWTIDTPDVEKAQEFLETHDHEGADVLLTVKDTVETEVGAEEAYEFLDERVDLKRVELELGREDLEQRL